MRLLFYRAMNLLILSNKLIHIPMGKEPQEEVLPHPNME